MGTDSEHCDLSLVSLIALTLILLVIAVALIYKLSRAQKGGNSEASASIFDKVDASALPTFRFGVDMEFSAPLMQSMSNHGGENNPVASDRQDDELVSTNTSVHV